MAHKMRKVFLLGAFEISAEMDPPVRDGIILGSRREQKGFVLETSRDHIEQIVNSAQPGAQQPKRLPVTLGESLRKLGCELVRVELRPLPGSPPEPHGGSYVQGTLVYRAASRVLRLAMTATEAIQVALSSQLPIMAAADLLQLDVSQFLDEIDAFSEQYHRETQDFKHFVDNVTATDFSQYLKKKKDGE